jgi:hypothetical protein
MITLYPTPMTAISGERAQLQLTPGHEMHSSPRGSLANGMCMRTVFLLDLVHILVLVAKHHSKYQMSCLYLVELALVRT